MRALRMTLAGWRAAMGESRYMFGPTVKSLIVGVAAIALVTLRGVRRR